MRLRFQLVIEPDDQPPVITDLLRVERSDLDPGSLGLHLSEAHELLNHGQSAMVTSQVNEFVDNARQCADCHRYLGCKRHHEVVYRTGLVCCTSTARGSITVPIAKANKPALGARAMSAIRTVEIVRSSTAAIPGVDSIQTF